MSTDDPTTRVAETLSREVIKIKNVQLYTALCENAKENYDALKFLRDQGIPFKHYGWNNDTEHVTGVIEPLRTWTFNTDGREESKYQRHFTKFPIAVWEIVDSEFDKYLNAAEGLEEIMNSQLIVHKDKIDVPKV